MDEEKALALVPAYSDFPLSWEHCQTIVRTNQLELLGRSTLQQSEYDTFTTGLQAMWRSTTDYLLHSKFDLPFTLDSNGKRVVARDSSASHMVKLTLLTNDFPYHFAPGILHLVLWKLGETLTKADIDKAVREVHDAGAVDVLSYVNPPHLKSILEVDHAHILVLKRPVATSDVA